MADRFEHFVDLEDLTPQQYLTLAAHACIKLGWRYALMRENEFSAQTSTNLASWGENVWITFEDNKARIISQCATKQVIDWGKNKTNVRQLTDMIARLRQELSPEQLDDLSVMESENPDHVEARALQERYESGTLTASDKLALGTGGFFVTYSLIAINVLVFIAMIVSGVGIMDPSGGDIYNWGGNMRDATVSGDWWRLITSTFVHIGIIHLFLNMYALFSLGVYLEPIMGRWKYLAAYLATGVLASVTSIWWSGDRVSAGASGAIFGLAGIWVALLTTNFIDKKMRGGLLQSMAIFVGYNLLYGLKGNVDNAAHIGGLVSGMAVGYLFFFMHSKERQLKLFSVACIATAVVVSVFMLDYLKDAEPSFLKQVDAIQQLDEKAHAQLTKKLAAPTAEFIEYVETEGLPAYRKMDSMVDKLDAKDLDVRWMTYIGLLDAYFDQRILYLQTMVEQANAPSEAVDARIDSINAELDKTVTLINEFNSK